MTIEKENTDMSRKILEIIALKAVEFADNKEIKFAVVLPNHLQEKIKRMILRKFDKWCKMSIKSKL